MIFKRMRWLVGGMLALLGGIMLFMLVPAAWKVAPSTTDVCGQAIVAVPLPTQRAMQQTMYSNYILNQTYEEGRISRDQFYLYQMYLANRSAKYPEALRSDQASHHPGDDGFYRYVYQDTYEKFCTFSPCVQQELNTIRFGSRLQCQQGVRITITPMLTVTPTP